jgi:hypothetical protein
MLNRLQILLLSIDISFAGMFVIQNNIIYASGFNDIGRHVSCMIIISINIENPIE